MRISDWSSDVCSSDLGRRRTARAARQLRLIGAAAMFDAIGEAGVHRFAAEMEIRLARMAHRPFADALRQVQQRRLARNVRAGLGGNQAARRGRGDRRLLVARPLTQEAARRSEEHTSELQSLMRISYAVFCLKKKKKKNTK